MAKVFIAMSGGVDSAITAALMKKQYHQVVGVHALFWKDKQLKKQAMEDKENAQRIAGQLNIPFYVIDLSKAFKSSVVKYYLGQYRQGLTPNPCVVCNRELKFGLLREKIKNLGGDKIAFGHYVIKKNNRLFRGKDLIKDQSYFLWSLQPEQIKDALFPLGRMLKQQVKAKAKKLKLLMYERPESQGVCFFAKGQHQNFIKQYLGDLLKPGKVINDQGKIVGQHQGVAYYTIGQRYGFKLDPIKLGFKGKNLPPLFVIKINARENQMVIGTNQDLLANSFKAKNLNWIWSKPAMQSEKSVKVDLQIRYLQPSVPAEIKFVNDLAEIKTKEKIRSIAPGQSAVFYQGNELIGGGIICND